MDILKLSTLAAKVTLPAGTPTAAVKGKSAELYIYGDIGPVDLGGTDAKTVVDQIASFKGATSLAVHINSVGGSVFEGIAIYQALKSFNGPVTIYVDGIAASIASVIAMAGDRIVMAPEATMMVHLPFCVTAGNASDLRAMADLLDRTKASLVSIYTKRTKLPEAKIEEMLAAETWLNAKEAVAAGFADSVSGDSPQAALVETPVAAPTKLAIHARITQERLALARMEVKTMQFGASPTK